MNVVVVSILVWQFVVRVGLCVCVWERADSFAYSITCMHFMCTCLFVFMLYIPVNSFSVMSGRLSVLPRTN